MSSEKKPIIYHKRNGIWYVQFLNPATGAYLSAKSTRERSRNRAEAIVSQWLQTEIPSGRERRTLVDECNVDTCLRIIRNPSFSSNDAARVVEALKDRGFLSGEVQAGDSSSPLFVEYLDTFWNYDESPYIKERLNAGRKIGRRYAHENRGYISRYIKDFFSGKRLFEISDNLITEFLNSLRERGLSPATVNQVRKSLVVPLGFAYKKHYISVNPGVFVDKFAGDPQKRGILSNDEADAVFKVEWTDRRAFVANMLARATGMRQGEILALRISDIGLDRVFVNHSWSSHDGLKTPKNGKTRVVPVGQKTMRVLREFMDNGGNPFQNDPERFIFFSSVKDKPMEPTLLTKCLYEALERLDPPITAEIRKERNIVFHSWRHFAAKFLASHADQETGMLVTGHETEAIFAEYSDHKTAADQEISFKKMQKALSGIDEPTPETLKIGSI